MSQATTLSPKNSGNWWGVFSRIRTERTHARIIGGSLIMLIGSGLVSAVNFGYNVAVARLLGPEAFGHAAAAVTLLMLVSAITLSFQLVCAKFIARNETAGARAEVYNSLMHRAWFVGIALGSLLIIASDKVAHYLNLPSSSLVMLLAMGVAFYIPLGVKRGGFQGICYFRRLTANFLLEALVRFLGAIVLIEAGFGVTGAVGAIAASVVLAYFLPPTPRILQATPVGGLPASFREGMAAIVFFVGQVIINNIDILLVKHFFTGVPAGIYAAVALVGRVLYFFSWSVVSAMFPISAGAKKQDESASVLIVPLVLVLSISVVFTLALGLFPDLVLRAIFGAGFNASGRGLDSLLMLYAASTGTYSLAVVLMAYEMSRKVANTGWIQLAFSGAIVVGIGIFHSSLRQVVVVQLVLMTCLLITASLPFFRIGRHRLALGVAAFPAVEGMLAPPVAVPAGRANMRRVRRVTEAEVISEFLKNEFYHPEFKRDRHRFERWVRNPDNNNEAENALRRALLFRRRETMWRELPADTEWWEVEITPAALERIRVFPRAQWRKVASGNFGLSDIVERIRTGTVPRGPRLAAFISKVLALSSRLRFEHDGSTVLLIGIDEEQPLTIIEGNHRLTAAMLASPEITLRRFRYVCGFSPHMTECCWYQTNLTTLWRYARNRVKILVYDREAEIARLLRHHQPENADSSDVATEVSCDKLVAEESDALRGQAS